jgi:hypothetical protein
MMETVHSSETSVLTRATRSYIQGDGITKRKQTPWPLVRLNDRHLLAKFSTNFCGYSGVTCSGRRIPTAVNLTFLDRSRYFSFE